ncbi:hypothetical protein [Aureispira anguillae]|uniref:DUF3291 domain-containing protein n=1 Tax=Aureispira anguillae TaxID=2864201 RepID=A0A915YFV5_9BACT|nr:hypothetical protein [Aureispira anguillae]BDS12241.1 hypothetical protein AsAng_0029600 [Aureispira anguillae]
MIITVTSVRLRSLWYYFKLSWHGLKITLQVRKAPGFIKMKNTGFGYLHYTITSWESKEDMQKAMLLGAHGEAMKESAKLAIETGSYTYESDRFPSWKEAKEKLKLGHFIKY